MCRFKFRQTQFSVHYLSTREPCPQGYDPDGGNESKHNPESIAEHCSPSGYSGTAHQRQRGNVEVWRM